MSDPTSIELPAGSLKERCERFGIPWLDEAPELDSGTRITNFT